MRVALITDGIWPYVLGGMQKHSYYLCKYLARKQVQVDLFHFNQSNYAIEELAFFTEAERKYIRSFVLEFPEAKPIPGHYLRRSFKYSELVFERILPHLPEYHFIYSKGFSGWKLIHEKHRGKVQSAPIGVNFHGYEMFQTAPSFKIKLQQWLLLRNPVKQISREADMVFSYGGKITPIIQSLGVPDSKLFEMPSGVEEHVLVNNIRETGKRLSFLFLGRYERRKGIEELYEALHRLTDGASPLPFDVHVVGPIPDSLVLTMQGLHYHGEIRDPALLKSKLNACDILICPSWSEGMPNVILEAMANGLAVIATDVGATRVLVDNSCGWLLPNNEPAALARVLQTVNQTDRKQIDTLKQAALTKIREHFVWDVLIERFCKRFLHSPA